MKNLARRQHKPSNAIWLATDPNVAPEPSMYCPSDLITPFGPAPYLIMLTLPMASALESFEQNVGSSQIHTKDEPDNDPDSYKRGQLTLVSREG